jgi:hypothetical protein
VLGSPYLTFSIRHTNCRFPLATRFEASAAPLERSLVAAPNVAEHAAMTMPVRHTHLPAALALAWCVCTVTAVLYYGTLTAAWATGATVGIHLFLLGLNAAPRRAIMRVGAAYALLMALTWVWITPVRVRQSTRPWLPREEIAYILRLNLFSASIRTGDKVAYQPRVSGNPLSLGIVAAISGQRFEFDAAVIRVDGTTISPTPALARVLQRTPPVRFDRQLGIGELAVLPLTAHADPVGPGDANSLAYALPGLLIIHEAQIVGRVRGPHRHVAYRGSERPRWEQGETTQRPAGSPCSILLRNSRVHPVDKYVNSAAAF